MMKNKLIQIFASKQGDEETAKQIIALAVAKSRPSASRAEMFGDALIAYREVIQSLGDIQPSKVSISPRLTVLLCDEMERRTRGFVMAEGTEIFSRGESQPILG